MKLQTENPAKKNYRKPRLHIYGNISEVTKNVTDMNAVMDNPSMKT